MDENEHDIQNPPPTPTPPPAGEESVSDGSAPTVEPERDAKAESQLTSNDAPSDEAPVSNDAEQAVESATESLENLQSLAEDQSDDTLHDIHEMLSRHGEMMERRIEATGGDRESITEARKERRQGFDELIGQIDSALSQPIEDAPTGPAPEIQESTLTPEAGDMKSQEETTVDSSSGSVLEEIPEEESMKADVETELSEDPSPESESASEPQVMEMELPSAPSDQEESTEAENGSVIEHSDEDIERILAQALGETESESADSNQTPTVADAASSEKNDLWLTDEGMEEELSRLLAEAMDMGAPASAPEASDGAPDVEAEAAPDTSASTDDREEAQPTIISPDETSSAVFVASDDIDQELNDLLESVLVSTAVQSQSDDEGKGLAASYAIMPLLDENDPEYQEITDDLKKLLDLAFSEDSPADDQAGPSTVDIDAQALPIEMIAETSGSTEPSDASMPVDTVDTEKTEAREEETAEVEAATAFPDEATASTVCDQIFAQLDAELNDSVASMMNTDMEAIEAVLDSIFDEQAMFVEDEEDSSMLISDMACDDTGGAVRPMPESLKGMSDSEANVPMDDSGETSPVDEDPTDELAGSLDDAVSVISSEIKQELDKTLELQGSTPTSKSAPADPAVSGGPLGKLWKKAEPPLVTVLSMVNWPLRKVPANARFLVDWFSLSMVFWVPVVWVLVMFVAGK